MPPPRRTGRLGWGPGTRTQKCRRKCGEWGGCSPSGLFTFGSPFVSVSCSCLLSGLFTFESPLLSTSCSCSSSGLFTFVSPLLSFYRWFLFHFMQLFIIWSFYLCLAIAFYFMQCSYREVIYHLVILPLCWYCFRFCAVFVQFLKLMMV